MKILKIKIQREQKDGKTTYTYHPDYLEHGHGRFKGLCYESQLEEGLDRVTARGNKDEYIIGVWQKDEDWNLFKDISGVEEITYQEAEEFLGVNLNKSAEKITDQNRVLSVLAKAIRKESLTEEDLAIIDPNDSTPGVVKSTTLKETLDKYLGE